MDTVSRIFHGHRDTTTIHGWVARDENGEVLFWMRRPEKEKRQWGGSEEIGMWISLGIDAFPQVKWEDKEPTPASITININH